MRGPVAARALAARWRAKWSRSDASGPPLMLVFSKDRAIQMELFLRSYAQQMSRPLPLTVMYRATSPAHQAAYDSVFSAYDASALTVIHETRFKDDLSRVLTQSRASTVMFLVDDIVFVRPVDSALLEAWRPSQGVLSLRLGANITRSFNAGNVAQSHPGALAATDELGWPLLRWRWVDAVRDWSLPTSLDGHLLPRPELAQLVRHTAYKAPNSLEGAIGQFKFLYKWNHGYCYETARIVNLPLNSVKTEAYDFPHLGWDSEELLAAFTRGLRLDIAELPLEQHDSCHMAWMPRLVDAAAMTSTPAAVTAGTAD